MVIELSEIKAIRKKYSITQSGLAKLANVSQSLIAKIESGRIDPTYSNAQKIFNTLNSKRKEKEKKAHEIMTDKIISIDPDAPIGDAVTRMKKHEISQMPVIEDNKAVGFVSESILLEAFVSKKQQNPIIRDVMGDCPPIVSKNAEVGVVSHLLKYYPMVLVSDEGRLIGLVTKADVLRKAYRT